MILWGTICGALIMLFAFGSNDTAPILGAILGAGAGYWLKTLVRSEATKIADARDTQMHAWVVAKLASLNTIDDAAQFEMASGPVAYAEPKIVDIPEAFERDIPSPWAMRAEDEEIASTQVPDKQASDGLFEQAKAWLLRGNLVVTAGLVMLFIGLSFLARYVANAGLFPIELRLALVAATGVALMVVGFARRHVRPEFSLALQGTGVAVIYLTIFAAARMFAVVPVLAAFVVMTIVCAISCIIALRQNSQTLAVAAFAGGFAVPVLLSTGAGSSVVLFGYYLVLNVAVLFIAQARAWRIVNLVGFIATFGVATFWGVLRYQPAEYLTSQMFLIAFIAIYLAAAVLYARRVAGPYGNFVDSSLLFGPALIGFGLQAGLVRHIPYGSAWSAVAFGSTYLILAALLHMRARESYRLFAECLAAIGIGFLTLSVPLAFDAGWTSSVWALEGVAAFWVGMRQARWLPRLFGVGLQVFAGFAFIIGYQGNLSPYPLVGSAFLGMTILAGSVLTIAWWMRQPLLHSGTPRAAGYANIEIGLEKPAFVIGFLLWNFALGFEVSRTLPPVASGLRPEPVFNASLQMLLMMTAFLASAWLAASISRKTGWAVSAWPSRVTIFCLWLNFSAQTLDGHHVHELPDVLFWVSAMGMHYRMLFLSDLDEASETASLRRWTHVGSLWLLLAMFTDLLSAAIDRLGWQAWDFDIVLISATGVLFALAQLALRAPWQSWPLSRNIGAYAWTAAIPIAGFVFLAAFAGSIVQSGASRPYIPLLNTVDAALAMAIAAVLFWRRAVLSANLVPENTLWVRGNQVPIAVASLTFVVLNTVWMRFAHHYLGVSWSQSAMLGSFIVQTGISIMWTLLAVLLMLAAHRRTERSLWLVGAGLLAVVVAKLFLVDLSNAGGGARVVSFIAVGGLMLVVGYFAPLPPRNEDGSDTDGELPSTV